MRPEDVSTPMNAHVGSGTRTAPRRRRSVPAYGPVDAVLGYVLFYVVVDRATPTVVDVIPGVLDVSASLVRLGLAAFLWFVLVTTALDQARRQLAALGVVDGDTRESFWSPAIPSETQTLAYVALLAVGGLVAAWTFEPAIETAVSLIRVVAALDGGAFDLAAFAVMVVFFVSFETAAYALDRLLVGGIRMMLVDEPGIDGA
jgi:hypothetical protein